ncbi:hypothetical protein [Streptomyces buecherae]|uniref:hypothetical protein n=1 Tax=Streptomyces buecherae TaxID=2763006 RepID=UPI003794315F
MTTMSWDAAQALYQVAGGLLTGDASLAQQLEASTRAMALIQAYQTAIAQLMRAERTSWPDIASAAGITTYAARKAWDPKRAERQLQAVRESLLPQTRPTEASRRPPRVGGDDSPSSGEGVLPTALCIAGSSSLHSNDTASHSALVAPWPTPHLAEPDYPATASRFTPHEGHDERCSCA